MKHISLQEADVLRLRAENIIRKAVQDFFNDTGLTLEVNIITQSTPTSCGRVFSVNVKAKATIE